MWKLKSPPHALTCFAFLQDEVLFKFLKMRYLNLIVSQLFGVLQSPHMSYLLVKSNSCFIFTYNSYFGSPKDAIVRASNKIEISDH